MLISWNKEKSMQLEMAKALYFKKNRDWKLMNLEKLLWKMFFTNLSRDFFINILK